MAYRFVDEISDESSELNQPIQGKFRLVQEKKPEKSFGEKAARLGGQLGLSLAENALLPYEATNVLSKHMPKDVESQLYRQSLPEDIETHEQAKQLGGFPGRNEPWNEQDEQQLNLLKEQLQNPEKSEEFAHSPVPEFGIRTLAEKATGQDLHPEGVLEKSIHWLGYLKDPKKIVQAGLNPKQVLKALSPTGTETLRSLGAGAAFELAEQGQFGPIGTMAALVIGDAMGGGTSALIKGAKDLLTKPKETFAKVTAAFTPKEKMNLQKEMINDFREAGLQADIGTITDSNMLKWMQSRLSQSGLSGKALDDFKHELTGQFREEYRKLAGELGEARFASNHEAGEVAKSTMNKIREADLSATRELYQNANKALKEDSFVNPKRLLSAIQKLESELTPGAIKSGEQQAVLNTLEKIKRDITDSTGNMMYAKVKDLMNDKIALNDIINYEVQGGSKQLLKGIVAELDRAIISHGKDNPTFAKNYVNANKRFSQHAKTFRNKTANQMLSAEDPATLMNKMNSVQGIRNIEKILSKTPGGKETLGQLKRLKFDQVVGDNLVNSTTDQVKLGTFSKLLEKGKNKEIIREILGPEGFKRLERLQKNAGKLADAADKFYNASKSGTVAVDAALIAQGMSGIAQTLMGNPWPLMKITGGILGARKLSQLLADPKFLKLVEDVIIASEKGTQAELFQTGELLRPYILEALQQNQ